VLNNEIGHADANETSLMLAIRPDLVNMKKAKSGSVKVGTLKSDKKLVLSRLTTLPSSFPKLTSSGVWGNPSNADSKKGKIMLEQISKRLSDAINDIERVYGTVFKGRK